jgi:uncharacterized protein (TIGR03546 family)
MAASFRTHAAKLWREHTSPLRLGAAVALGIVVGCSPFYGLHFFIGLALAVILRLNKFAVFFGSQISIPPIAPLLGFASVQVGSFVLEGHGLHVAISDFTLARLPDLLRAFLLSWLVGGVLLGSALALPAFFLVALVVKKRRSGSGPAGRSAADESWKQCIQRTVQRFAKAPRGHRSYVALKLRLDPVFYKICSLLRPRVSVLDLGTGLGFFPILLALREQAITIVGIDWDAEKIASGRAASAGIEAVTLRQEDVRRAAFPPVDAVLLIDLLHYYPLSEQRELLRRAAAALSPGGLLIIRETERSCGSLVTRLMEAAAVQLGWNKGPGLCYRTAGELQADLEALGLRCTCDQASSSLHRGNFLLSGTR